MELDPVALALDEVSARQERVERAFNELESRRAGLSSCIIEWKQLEDHFAGVELSLRMRYAELGERERALDARAREVEDGLSKRAEAISAREEASLARVQEQREAAIAAIVEEKRRLNLENASSAGVSNSESPGDSDHEHTAANTQQNSDESNGSPVDGPTPTPSPAKPSATMHHHTEVRVRPELKTFCENMDGEGLRRYVSEHRKDVNALRVELPAAIQGAIDPARLVLDALEGYNVATEAPPHHHHHHHHHPPLAGGGDGETIRKDCGASANRRACVLVLESVASALADPVEQMHPVVPPNIRERAKELADRWKSKMDSAAAAENALDAQVFLQLLATFGIASEYDEEELCRLVTTVARRRQSPALCRALGLSRRIPDMVDRLAREGKQVEALAFAHAFDIMDRVEPVTLLKAYLKEAKKNAQNILKNGNNSPAAQNDSSMKELAALKSVLKCIEEYKLEPQLASQPLQKRIEALEKAKADRKRAAVAVKGQSKRLRVGNNGTGAIYCGGAGGGGVAGGDRNFSRSSERAQFGAGMSLSTFGLASQTGFDRRGQGGYATTFAAGNRNPVSMSTSYLFSADAGLGSSLYGSAATAAYGNPSYNYQFGGGLPPPPPAYQASFLH